MVEIGERRRWTGERLSLLIGPGAAGKSTLGLRLAPLLDRRLIDLDQEFGRRYGPIDTFITVEGYHHYKLLNSTLAEEVVGLTLGSLLLVTSSGFLTPDNPPAALITNRRLLADSYSICLPPSCKLDRTVSVIVDRQLQRPFSRARAQEEAIIRARFPVYRDMGDLIVFSEAAPEIIARELADRLRV